MLHTTTTRIPPHRPPTDSWSILGLLALSMLGMHCVENSGDQHIDRAQLQATLVDHFPLDGTVANTMRNQQNFATRISSVEAVIDQGLSFNGTNDYVAIQSFYQGTIPQLSVCAWIKTSATGGNEFSNWSIVDFDRSEYYNLYVHGGTGVIGFSTATTAGFRDTYGHRPVNDDQWHFVCGTYDGKDTRIYVDGVQDGLGVNLHQGRPLGTGARRYGFLGDGSEATSFNGGRNEYYFEGAIDDVRIYSGTLNRSEIQGLMRSELTLVDHFPLDQGGENLVRPQENVLRGTTVIDGVFEKARRFNGTSDVIALRTSYSGTVPKISLCAWVRTSFAGPPMSNWSIIDFDRSEYFNLFVDGPSGRAGFSSRAKTIHDMFGETKINDGLWHHVCAVYDGVDKRLFVDGHNDGVVTNAHHGQPLGTGVVRFGFIGDGSEASTFNGARNKFHFDGDIDDVRIYNDAIGVSEIEELLPARAVGLVDYFPLDEGPQNVTRAQDNIVSGTTVIDGVFGKARHFNGTSDVIALQSAYAHKVQEISLCAWVRTSFSGSDWSNWSIIDFDRSEYFNLYVDGRSGRAAFSSQASTTHDMFGDKRINDGNWHHLCAVYDGSDKRLYVDGREDSVVLNAHAKEPLGTGVTRFGFIGDGSEATRFNGARNKLHFEGDIDDVRIYDIAIQDTQIALLAVRPSCRPGASSETECGLGCASPVCSGGQCGIEVTCEELTTPNPTQCEKGRPLDVVLSPGTVVEPCAGFKIDVPMNAISDDTPVTFTFAEDLAKVQIRDQTIYQEGLVQVIHMEPSMVFGEPLEMTLGLDLLGAQSSDGEYATVLVDDIREPHVEIHAAEQAAVRLLVPHFSEQAVFNWSSMGANQQSELMAWTENLSGTPPPQLGSPDATRLRGSADGCVPTVNGVNWNEMGNGITAGVHGRFGRPNKVNVAGLKMSQCVQAEFAEGFSGKVYVRARQRNNLCSGALNCIPYNEEKCNKQMDFWVFHAVPHTPKTTTDFSKFKKTSDQQLLTTEFQTYAFDVPPTSRFVLVCLGDHSSENAPMEIDAIMTDPLPCPPATSGFTDCDNLCNLHNTQPNCGCSGQWRAKADFLMSKKPAFWPGNISTDDFYDHTGTEVQYRQRLECTLGDDSKIFTNQNSKLASNGNWGGIPSDPSMEPCDSRSTGWVDVAGPTTVQQTEAGLNPWKRYKALVGCACGTFYKPNPGGIVPLNPPSLDHVGGHVCNDSSVIQLEAWVSGICDPNHPTCSDDFLRLEGPGGCGP